jgi:hypothetical protein
MPPGPAPRLLLFVLLPLLVAASDPKGDVVGCGGGTEGDAPDLVGADGSIVEFGTSARWQLTFAEPLAIPDAAGHPFRIDVVIRDPDVPPLSFAYYRHVNRLVRVDATVDHPTEIYLLPERGTNEFLPPTVAGPTMTIQVPGRILTEDEDLTGTSPGLETLRWSVIVRDGRACDFLGDGSPRERLVPERPAPRPPRDVGRPNGNALPWIAAGAVAVGGLLAYVVRRAR